MGIFPGSCEVPKAQGKQYTLQEVKMTEITFPNAIFYFSNATNQLLMPLLLG
jgi:hypothetical protein